MVSDMFLKFASTGPQVELSPETKKKSHLGKAKGLPSPSPTSKMRRMVLKDPNKKGLTEYDKTLSSHEAAVRKGLQELDKATHEFRESAEMRDAMQQKLEEKLLNKRKRAENLALGARRTRVSVTYQLFVCSECLLRTSDDSVLFLFVISEMVFSKGRQGQPCQF